MAKGYLLQNDDDSYTVSTAVNVTLKKDAVVNQVGGIGIGKCCYVSGQSGGKPKVSLASVSNADHIPAFGVSAEAKTDGQDIQMVTSGEVEVDTTIMTAVAAIGQTVYLGESGLVDNVPTTAVSGNLKIGRILSLGASGSIIVDTAPFFLTGTLNDVLRNTITNNSTGASAAASFTTKNDAARYASFGITGSGAANPSRVVMFNEGYGETAFVVDGNEPFRWLTDVTDAHTNSFTEKMLLTPDGILGLGDFTGGDPFDGTQFLTNGIHIKSANPALVMEDTGNGIISIQAGTSKKFYLRTEVASPGTQTDHMTVENDDSIEFPSAPKITIGDGTANTELVQLFPNSVSDAGVLSFYETSYENNGLQFTYDSGSNTMNVYDWSGGVKDTTPLMSIDRGRDSVRFENLELLERSSDPAKPAEGKSVTWQSDGTGLGDDGDIIMASTAGGVTKYTIIHDHSAGVTW